MDAAEIEAAINVLAQQPESDLEAFFLAHGLQDAFNSPGKGWGRKKKINAALATARKSGGFAAVLDSAIKRFGAREGEEAFLEFDQESGSPSFSESTPRVDARLVNLHESIRKASGKLFLDGHFADAIFAAYRAVEARVRALSGVEALGRALMAKAFNEEAPVLALNDLGTLTDRDEQEGFRLIFMGAMQGIRNPKAHDVIFQEDEDRTLDYLALASLLMRRLDDTESLGH